MTAGTEPGKRKIGVQAQAAGVLASGNSQHGADRDGGRQAKLGVGGSSEHASRLAEQMVPAQNGRRE